MKTKTVIALVLSMLITGIFALASLRDILARNGVYVLTGIPGGDRPLQVPGAEVMSRLVLYNQAMMGSVNAAPGHFRMAANDLMQAEAAWRGHVEKIITNRYPVEEFKEALSKPSSGEIKTIIEWA